MRLLLTGDIHIGRSSSRVARDLEAGTLRATSAWRRIVDAAIQEHVDVVCLSGDVADKENKFWEAIGPLEQGVRRLSEAGITTVAVSGNHDYDVLGRLADHLEDEDFHLLGRSGSWERFTITRDGRPVLHVDGWSFPRETVPTSPLLSYDLVADATIPILGLVHGDLDVSDSSYAPLESSRLRSLPPNAWMLGHIHAPALRGEAPWIIYPGSPQALDFGEPGIHGVWIVEVDHALSRPTLLPLSTVRYDALEINVSGAQTVEDVETLILRALQSTCTEMIEECGALLECLMLRLSIVGRTVLSHRMAEITDGLEPDLSRTLRGVVVEIERLDIATLPDVDVEHYADAKSAPGAVARLLVELDADDVSDEVAGIISATRRALEDNMDDKYFLSLEKNEVTEEDARAQLRREARALLTQLVAQTT